MECMFMTTINFNQPLNDWNVLNAKTICGMYV